MGYGILDIGAQTRQQGMMGLRDAANREQDVELANQNLKTARKGQTMNSIGAGAGIGAIVGGPVGALVGGGIGFLADSLF
ncbi:bacteriocin [Aeromonas sp. MdU4]|uniref:bacteriocin n=1 Tax=Aeromonas sp. MdU4 TaxID=3342819 RepID=UPI0035B9678F